ncbi:hypothetical protein T12_14205 [Trichinella patagoniensis]|uniref:Uncharacterized protein n=1 Tax=Trichinella patagoniensis TaxID=990121 RepID=A0A0V0Z5D9_9BILA|nr:hypothetical protein T12_14205 [Trichinella patagoniensis]
MDLRDVLCWKLFGEPIGFYLNLGYGDNSFVSNILNYKDTVIGYSWMMIDCMFGDRDVMQLNSHDSNAIQVIIMLINQ